MKPTPGADNLMERWICPGCGNENYEGRLFCNMRKCGAAKPGLTAADLARHPTGGGLGFVPQGLGKGYARPPPAAAPMIPPPFQGAHQGAPPGSWKCLSCGNVNYPQRTQCNGQNGRCGQPRSAVDGGPPILVTPQQVPPPSAPYVVPPPQPPPRPSGGGSAPPGSWVCLACKNVNYPTRTQCNARECGRPREEVDGGAPEAAGDHGFDGFEAAAEGMGVPQCPPARTFTSGASNNNNMPPEGSWVCPACANVNWPTRTVCNKRSCGLPRPTEG